MVAMPDSDGEDLLIQQAKRDNLHFKALLNLVPPQSYFTHEEKLEILGENTGDSDEEGSVPKSKEKKRKKFTLNPFTTFSVTEIIELKLKGLIGAGKQISKSITTDVNRSNDKAVTIEEKHKNKKLSRSTKGHKNKGKEIERREARLEELKEQLRKKLEEIKAKKNSGSALNSQELKKLKRQEKKVNAKLKTTNKTIKEQKLAPVADSQKPPPDNKIAQNGGPVKSKFDFSVISYSGNKSRSSDLHGRDYKRLLEKVEKRKEKVDKLKEKDMEAGKKLEEKFQWQAALSKAKGEKVKDDPNLLKKAAKRKDKIKDKRKKKWDGRVNTVEELQQKRQKKRQVNIDKRKSDKKDKKRKRLIKKGRIIPGL